MALFSNRPNQAASDNLIEFPAGKCVLRPAGNPEQREVVSQPAKGTIYIRQSDDMLVHFCWKNRETGQVMDDLIVFPGDTSFLKVAECPIEAGRVFMFKFKGSEPDRWFLYWMQDADASRDTERCDRVNQLLNAPPTAHHRGGGLGGRGRGGLGDQLAGVQGQLLGLPASMGVGAEDLNALSQMDSAQLQQLLAMDPSGLPAIDPNILAQFGMPGLGASLLGGAGAALPTSLESTPTSRPSTTTTTAGSRAGTGGTARGATGGNNNQQGGTGTGALSGAQARAAIQLADLQSLLSALPAAAQQQRVPVDLEDVVSGSNVTETVNDTDNAELLMPLLPSEQPIEQNVDELRQTVHSPQYRQAARAFGEALASGQLGPVLQQFNLPAEAVAAANVGDVHGLAAAMERGAGHAQGSGDASESVATTTTTSETDSVATPSAEKEPDAKRSKAAGDAPQPPKKPDDEGMDLD